MKCNPEEKRVIMDWAEEQRDQDYNVAKGSRLGNTWKKDLSDPEPLRLL